MQEDILAQPFEYHPGKMEQFYPSIKIVKAKNRSTVTTLLDRIVVDVPKNVSFSALLSFIVSNPDNGIVEVGDFKCDSELSLPSNVLSKLHVGNCRNETGIQVSNSLNVYNVCQQYGNFILFTCKDLAVNDEEESTEQNYFSIMMSAARRRDSVSKSYPEKLGSHAAEKDDDEANVNVRSDWLLFNSLVDVFKREEAYFCQGAKNRLTRNIELICTGLMVTKLNNAICCRSRSFLLSFSSLSPTPDLVKFIPLDPRSYGRLMPS